MKFNNIPEYAYHRTYGVFRRVNGAYWFWGAYDDRDTANAVALEEGGAVFAMSEL